MNFHIRKITLLLSLFVMVIGLSQSVSANQSYRYSTGDFDVTLSYKVANATYSLNAGSDQTYGSTLYVEISSTNDVGLLKVNDASFDGDEEISPDLISGISSYDIDNKNGEFVEDLSESSLESIYSDRVYEYAFIDVVEDFEKNLLKQLATKLSASVSDLELVSYHVSNAIVVTELSSDFAESVLEAIEDGEEENNDDDFTKSTPLVSSGVIVGESSILASRFSPTKLINKVEDKEVDGLEITTQNDLLASQIEINSNQADEVFGNTSIELADYTYASDSSDILLDSNELVDSDVLKYFGVAKKLVSLRGLVMILILLFVLMLFVRYMMLNYDFNPKNFMYNRKR